MTAPTEREKTERQLAAWEAYRLARRKADRTLDIEDGIASVRAYKEFYNLFVDDDRRLPIDPTRQTVTTFPFHKTRPLSIERR
ncbi:hypothetical protein AB3480_06605 [Rhizobium mongolense]|uniref:hypothetical protein n=1 Tax=Rhizobium mongolense TaxID=57676 RepID=UPI0034A0E7FE